MSAADSLGPMFHGTTHPFKVGDVVAPRQSHGTDKEAFASDDPWMSWEYADRQSQSGETGSGTKIRGGKGRIPRVFRVEPVDPTENLTNHDYGKNVFVSKKGYRVVNEEDM